MNSIPQGYLVPINSMPAGKEGQGGNCRRAFHRVRLVIKQASQEVEKADNLLIPALLNLPRRQEEDSPVQIPPLTSDAGERLTYLRW